MSPPLHGLVLAGGHSSRMRSDKAALSYGRIPQLTRAFELLEQRVDCAYVSVRADQVSDRLRAGYPQIIDGTAGSGPIAGIIAAQARQPDAAWLVLACDLPLLDGTTLDQLIASRDAGRLATAFRNATNGLPEPLCTIYEPASRQPILDHVAAGRDCPRKFLLAHDVLLLDPVHPAALDNANTPRDYEVMRATKRVRLQYYAFFREQAGRQSEVIDTVALTPAELYEELAGRHGFKLSPSQLKVAVNAAFSDWDRALRDDDEVVFIPPVAGG